MEMNCTPVAQGDVVPLVTANPPTINSIQRGEATVESIIEDVFNQPPSDDEFEGVVSNVTVFIPRNADNLQLALPFPEGSSNNLIIKILNSIKNIVRAITQNDAVWAAVSKVKEVQEYMCSLLSDCLGTRIVPDDEVVDGGSQELDNDPSWLSKVWSWICETATKIWESMKDTFHHMATAFAGATKDTSAAADVAWEIFQENIKNSTFVAILINIIAIIKRVMSRIGGTSLSSAPANVNAVGTLETAV